MEIFLGEPPANIKQWIIEHYGPVVKPETYIKFSDGTEFYDIIEFPDGLDGIFDLRTAIKYGWTNEGSDGYDGPPDWDIKQPVEVVLGSNVTSIGNYAFYNCSGLTSVTIGNGVTSIGWDAFTGCSGLTSVTIPDSVTSIGNSAFYGCSGLTSVTIPDSVTSIGYNVFDDCTGLTSVTIFANGGDAEAVKQAMIDAGVESSIEWIMPS